MDLRSTGMSIYKESEYKYHTSWDWLMPVIIKIAGLTDHGIKIGHLDTIQSAYEFAVKFIEADNSPYPFSEGDEHWVEEDGEYIWSVWDDVSEELHDQNPNKQYYTSSEFIQIARQGGFTIR